MMKNKSTLSNVHKKFIQKQRNRKIIINFLRVFILIALFALWELFAHLGVIDSFIMSSPTRIWKCFWEIQSSGELYRHTLITLYENLLGFGISTLLGTLIAIALWWSLSFREITEPYLVVLNSLPKIALGPIIIIWVGAGTASIVTMAVLIGIIITIINMQSAFLSVDNQKILLLKSMGATKLQLLTKLILPYSIPAFISVMKINVGLSWVGTIIGEYLSSKAGLGYLIVYGGQVFKLDLVMCCTIILCILASLMYFVVAMLEKCFKKYQ